MDRIGQWLALFFDGLPYSEAAAAARDRIGRALRDAAPDELAARYGSYESLAALGGYTPEDAAGWRSTEALRDAAGLKKELRGQRRRAYAACSTGRGRWAARPCSAATTITTTCPWNTRASA